MKSNCNAINTIILLITALLLYPAITSAEQEELIVDLTYTPSEEVVEMSKSTSNPDEYPIFVIYDERTDKGCIGYTDVPLHCNNIKQWVTSAISSHPIQGIISTPEKANKKALFLGKAYIKRVSCKARQMNMRCSVLLEVEYFVKHISIGKKTYYGSAVQTKGLIGKNSRFNENKISEGLNEALSICIKKINNEIQQIKSI